MLKKQLLINQPKAGLGYAVATFPKDDRVDDVQKNLRAVLVDSCFGVTH